MSTINTLWDFAVNLGATYWFIRKIKSPKNQPFRDAIITIVFFITGFIIPGGILYKLHTQVGPYSGWDYFWFVLNYFIIFECAFFVVIMVTMLRIIKDVKITPDPNAQIEARRRKQLKYRKKK